MLKPILYYKISGISKTGDSRGRSIPNLLSYDDDLFPATESFEHEEKNLYVKFSFFAEHTCYFMRRQFPLLCNK